MHPADQPISVRRQVFPSDVTPDQFEQVRSLLEASRRRTRPRKHDLYDVFCAILYLLDSGAAWRNLPPAFPPWRTVHEYYRQWTEPSDGGSSLLVDALEQLGRKAAITRLR